MLRGCKLPVWVLLAAYVWENRAAQASPAAVLRPPAARYLAFKRGATRSQRGLHVPRDKLGQLLLLPPALLTRQVAIAGVSSAVTGPLRHRAPPRPPRSVWRHRQRSAQELELEEQLQFEAYRDLIRLKCLGLSGGWAAACHPQPSCSSTRGGPRKHCPALAGMCAYHPGWHM